MGFTKRKLLPDATYKSDNANLTVAAVSKDLIASYGSITSPRLRHSSMSIRRGDKGEV
ncbi:hypothetical protein [Nostoc sphaeroides]|uniref:Uncharacterized protein n=1 Tax=Nostoc sphaeroides CCNUC1 TaxID=2653204 RepID=A0A5P8W8F1_9NOSO|nr:hypothetical protein [Nostoc sphaeroides]MCC5627216.1 hypothetical protein [Nostoc sphaeroides CHAB 2801]QFS49035.1 hypothetical protein GXM_06529 [Nostoc sphaeroides CCNUC1]